MVRETENKINNRICKYVDIIINIQFLIQISFILVKKPQSPYLDYKAKAFEEELPSRTSLSNIW